MAALFPAELRVEGGHGVHATLDIDRFTEQGRQASGELRLLPREAVFEAGAPEGLALLKDLLLHPAFAHLDPKKMVKDGLSAPVHPGAMKYYKEKGWL